MRLKKISTKNSRKFEFDCWVNAKIFDHIVAYYDPPLPEILFSNLKFHIQIIYQNVHKLQNFGICDKIAYLKYVFS